MGRPQVAAAGKGWSRSAVAALSSLGMAAALWGGSPAAHAAARCLAAGNTGLTAAVVATKGEKITGVVQGTGCDLGIYVGPTASGVTIDGAQVSGANDQGILVQNAAHVTIINSQVYGNGLHPTICPLPPRKPTGPCINEGKAIELVGTTDAVVAHDIVVGNRADGGIGIADDGPIDPGALRPGILAAAKGNVVEDSIVAGNLNGCGIVVASYNPGAGVRDNTVRDNTVSDSVAGIVVAADVPGTQASGNRVVGNTLTDNFLPGVIVHSNTPGDVVTGTVVLGNTFSGNRGDPSADAGHGPKVPTAIVVVAEPLPPGVPPHTPAAVVTKTVLKGNIIAQGERDGIWVGRATATTIASNLLGGGVRGTVGMGMASATGPSGVVTQTAYTASYRVVLDIGSPQMMLSAAAAKTAKSGEVMVAKTGTPMPQMSMMDRGHPVNHHLEVHIYNRTSGAVVTSVTPTITITQLSSGASWSLASVVAMYGIRQGMRDYHFGNNVYLAPGRYDVRVQLGQQVASFHDLMVANAQGSLATPGSSG